MRVLAGGVLVELAWSPSIGTPSPGREESCHAARCQGPPDSTVSVTAKAAGRINGDREREFDVADIRRLPGRTAELWEWQVHGACRGMDSARFFYPEGERGPRRERREEAAKEICAHCPVLIDCRAHALQVQEPYGIWGGLTEHERLAILTHAAV